MLYIVSKESVEFCWHVGEKIPHDLLHGKTVIEVQADGRELDFVLKNFANIPHVAGNGVQKGVQKWRGDIAAFIADHLPAK